MSRLWYLKSSLLYYISMICPLTTIWTSYGDWMQQSKCTSLSLAWPEKLWPEELTLGQICVCVCAFNISVAFCVLSPNFTTSFLTIFLFMWYMVAIIISLCLKVRVAKDKQVSWCPWRRWSQRRWEAGRGWHWLAAPLGSALAALCWPPTGAACHSAPLMCCSAPQQLDSASTHLWSWRPAQCSATLHTLSWSSCSGEASPHCLMGSCMDQKVK